MTEAQLAPRLRLRQAGAALVCLVALFAQGGHQAAAFAGLPIKMPKVGISADAKGIPVSDSTPNIYSHCSVIDGGNIFGRRCGFGCGYKVNNLILAENRLGQIILRKGREWIGQRVIIIHDYRKPAYIISRSLSSIFHYAVEFNSLSRDNSGNIGLLHDHIRPQLTLGSILRASNEAASSNIQEPGRNRQNDRERSNENGAESSYFSLIHTNKIEKSSYIAIFIFLLLGPVAGFLLMIGIGSLYGIGFLIFWLLSVLYLLSGVWS
jgi:hypothetical protein